MCKKIACILITLTMFFSVLPVVLANEVNAEKEMKIITEVPMESIVSEYNKNTEPKSEDDLIYKKYGDYLYYYLNNNDTEITIVDCDDLATGEITVPSEIEGLPVTWICDIAFSECKNITKIVIPEGVKWIGENAFYNCNSLNEIIIPTTVDLIGRGAFYGTAYYNNASNWNNGFLCIGNNLIEADKAISGSCEIPSHINTIASYAFEDCTNLTNITIPENVKNIGENTFYHCNNLTTVNFNATECSIMGTSNHPVFNTCSNLTSVNIGNKVTEIPDNAFLNCVNMKKITIPSSVTIIGDDAFKGCELKSAGPVGGGYSYEFGWENEIPANAFSECHDLLDVTIPNGIKHIGDNAFFNCTSLTNVIIPEGVASIGDNVFENCDSLQNITLPNGITSIGDYAFSCCVSLKDIHIPESVTSIGNHTFENCSTISSIILPDGITSIGDYAFLFCTNLLDIKLSENVNSIGECAFAYCENIEKIIIPQNTKIIGNNAFESCLNLSDITISNGVTNIGAEAFQGCVSISNLTIPESIVSVGNNAFGDCTSLNTVFYNAISCTNMGSRYYPVFYGCENLTTLEIGDNVKTIPILAFNGCDKLTSITIPEGVTNIGKFAFNKCDSITTLNYNAVNCEAIGEYNIEENTYSAVFGGCSSLKEVNIGPNVKTIPDGTFSWCDAIERITIPENITSIGRSAFQDCINLKTVNYNAIDCVMGYYDKENNTLDSVFLGCNSLSEINIGKDVVRIPIGAFAWCYGVTQITIPETVLEIGSYAFYKCDNIETINYEGSKNDWENIIFNNNIFDNAIINYNQPIPDQGQVITPVPITTIEVLKTDIDNGTAYNFNISVGKTYENSSIYIAIFDGDNNLINVQTEKLNMYDSTDVKVNKTYGQKTAKIFVWNNKMQPITEITTIELI